MQKQRQRTKISYVIRDSYGSSLHRQGINALCIDQDSFNAGLGGLLFSGGRDTIINKWELKLPKSVLQLEEGDNVIDTAQVAEPEEIVQVNNRGHSSTSKIEHGNTLPRNSARNDRTSQNHKVSFDQLPKKTSVQTDRHRQHGLNIYDYNESLLVRCAYFSLE
jgi:hypothetical protein